MTPEGLGIALLVIVGAPLALVALLAILVAGVLTSVCAVPICMTWALAAMVRPQIAAGLRRTQPKATPSPTPTEKP